MAAHVQTVVVKAGNVTLTIEAKVPFGDNPAYYACQVENQLSQTAAELRSMLQARFGYQYSLEEMLENTGLPS